MREEPRINIRKLDLLHHVGECIIIRTLSLALDVLQEKSYRLNTILLGRQFSITCDLKV
jgi:hypothetical protein